MSNSDRVVLALGGAGKVGSGIVKALLDKGKLRRGDTKENVPVAPRTFGAEVDPRFYAHTASSCLLRAINRTVNIYQHFVCDFLLCPKC